MSYEGTKQNNVLKYFQTRSKLSEPVFLTYQLLNNKREYFGLGSKKTSYSFLILLHLCIWGRGEYMVDGLQ